MPFIPFCSQRVPTDGFAEQNGRDAEQSGHISFDEEEKLKSIFETNKNPQRIIELISFVAAGMLNRVYNVSKIEHPLPAFDKLNHFKLFVFDTGLLKHMAGIDNRAILLKTDYQFKGPLTENFVLQQLRRHSGNI